MLATATVLQGLDDAIPVRPGYRSIRINRISSRKAGKLYEPGLPLASKAAGTEVVYLTLEFSQPLSL
jgi:hypothetical protein